MSTRTNWWTYETPLSTVCDSTKTGQLILIRGCMFAGKTTELIKILQSHPLDQVLLIKHNIDQRYNKDEVTSHAGKSWPAVSVGCAADISNHAGQSINLVALDEAHFFDHALIDATQSLRERHLDVVLTALDLDSWGHPFPLIQRLLKMADVDLPLIAICANCGKPADHTQRLTPIIDGNMVGGPESYEPRCKSCWTPPPEQPPVMT